MKLQNIDFGILLLAALAAGPSDRPTGCPDLRELRSSFVKTQFDEMLMQGLWYEVVVKKDSQPRERQCQTSYKTINEDDVSLTDTFKTICYGFLNFAGNLQYQCSDVPALWTVNFDIPILDFIKFKNIAVEVGVNSETGEYDWMIEFTCMETDEDKIFYAINMYSRYEDPADKVALMEAIARDFGF